MKVIPWCFIIRDKRSYLPTLIKLSGKKKSSAAHLFRLYALKNASGFINTVSQRSLADSWPCHQAYFLYDTTVFVKGSNRKGTKTEHKVFYSDKRGMLSFCMWMQSESLLLSAVDSPALQWICSSIQIERLNSSVLPGAGAAQNESTTAGDRCLWNSINHKTHARRHGFPKHLKGHHREEAAS